MITLNLAMDDAIIESTANSAFEGTGWTYKSYLVEVNKDLDEDDKEANRIKRKRLYFFAISMVFLFPFIWHMIALVPWIFLKPVAGLALGLVLGQGLVLISDIFIT